MENMNEQIEKFINDFVNEAIEKSDTYVDAILYVNKIASLTELGQVIKKSYSRQNR
ncbi:TPA: hypothetical protein ACUBU3_001724 [Streptococcus pyogenes]